MQNYDEKEQTFAGLLLRFLSLLIDFIIFCILFFPITKIVKGSWIMQAEDHDWISGWFITDPLCVSFLISLKSRLL